MRFPIKIRKDLRLQDNTRSKITSSGLSSILKRKWTIIVLGIVIAVIGFAGVIYFGSQYLNEEVTGGGTLPYTASGHDVPDVDGDVYFATSEIDGSVEIFTFHLIKPL